MGCKFIKSIELQNEAFGFNRNIMGCKFTGIKKWHDMAIDLIGT